MAAFERAVGMLAQLHELGEASAHSRGSLASAQVKLAATLLKLNKHAECAAAVAAATALEPSIGAAVVGLAQLCERAPREGIDTSKVQIDMAL